ncbi:MAG: hypothetical protein ACQEQU_04285 [Spirochaetota bacterium]
MNLYIIAFTAYIYKHTTSFLETYSFLLNKVGNRVDLSKPEHRVELIKWLNKWGCRQFSISCREQSSGELLNWFENNKVHIEFISKEKYFWELSGQELHEISGLYNSLVGTKASEKIRANKRIIVSVGHTGASKILFALRPRIFVAWDEVMRREFKKRYQVDSYDGFLSHVQSDIEAIFTSCKRKGIDENKLLETIDRTDATLPQLVGEYYWLTMVRSLPVPSQETLQNWLNWSV